jgi:hypothetical protein
MHSKLPTYSLLLVIPALLFTLSSCASPDTIAEKAASTIDTAPTKMAKDVALRNASATFREIQALSAFEGGVITEAFIDANAPGSLTEGVYDPFQNSVTVTTNKRSIADNSESFITGVAYICVTGASSDPCS